MRRILLFILCLIPSVSWGWQDRYDDMVEKYVDRKSAEPEALSLQSDLLSEAPEGDIKTLWGLLWTGSPRDRSAAGLLLIEKVFPDGDPGRWDELKGFVNPSEIPLSLIAADGVMATISSLMKIDGGVYLAGRILDKFSSSTRAKLLFIRRCPTELSLIFREIAETCGLGGNWEPLSKEGQLPFASPVRGVISQSGAVSRGMQFLDGWGVPSNNGPYCWDRPSGRIYRVSDPDNSLWMPVR